MYRDLYLYHSFQYWDQSRNCRRHRTSLIDNQTEWWLFWQLQIFLGNSLLKWSSEMFSHPRWESLKHAHWLPLVWEDASVELRLTAAVDKTLFPSIHRLHECLLYCWCCSPEISYVTALEYANLYIIPKAHISNIQSQFSFCSIRVLMVLTEPKTLPLFKH